MRARDIRKRGGFCAVFIFQIPESFADCLGGLLSVVGQNLSLKLEAVGETLISATHANRPVQWSAANKRYRMRPKTSHERCIRSRSTSVRASCSHLSVLVPIFTAVSRSVATVYA